MSQADYTIADQDGASFLVDINAQLSAIVSNNSGATEPSTTYAYQWWADTSSGLLKLRNAANSAWLEVGTLASANLGLATAGANSDITSLSGLTTALTESQGGTGSTTGLYGFKNRIINGQFQIAQRATSATITVGSTIAAGYSTVDRFYAYCTGANVTAAQVAGSGNTKNRFQITGAGSVTAVGIGQRIEALNSYDLAGKTATLSVNISNSLLTSVTWTAYYANTADTFGTLASPTRTQIATGTFTVTSTLTNYSAQIAIPAAATTGIEIVLTVGAQTSGTWVIGNIQLEKGASKTGFDYRSYGTELALCQRYYETFGTSAVRATFGTAAAFNTTTVYANQYFTQSKRATPTIGFLTGSANQYRFLANAGASNVSSMIFVASINNVQIQATVGTAVTGHAGVLEGQDSLFPILQASAEL
jgi:hypothetical protein